MSDTLSAKKDDTLKIIALITMLIDHIGYLLLPQFFILRIIGRISFPIFAYYLALGATRTKQPKRYALRLLLFGFISQIPYNLMIHQTPLSFEDPNIFFTLLWGLMAIYCLASPKWYVNVAIVPLIYGVHLLNLSYGYYGILLILIFHWYHQKPLAMSLAMLAASFEYWMEAGNIYQFYALPVLVLLIYQPRLGLRLPKYASYLFYPVHLLALYAVYFFWT